jgi:ribosome-associated toxin RatA of RatAB toxin-antitoxin module
MRTVESPFDLSALMRTSNPIVHVALGAGGRAVSASAAGRVGASTDRVWSVLTDVGKYAERVPMMHRVRLRGDLAEFSLRLRISFFSVGFSFESEIERDEGRSLSLNYVRGEPRDIAIRWHLEPLSDGAESAIFVHIGFDIDSLGWMAKYFLKHHPEIQFGVFPGCAVALLESMRTAVRAA